MKSLDHTGRGVRTAAVAAAAGFAAVAAFQVALAAGAPLGRAAWGGGSAHLATGPRAGSAAAAVALGGAAAVVLARAGLLGSRRASRGLAGATWAIAGLLGLSAVANLASQSPGERGVLGPAALILAGLCAVVARGGRPRTGPRPAG